MTQSLWRIFTPSDLPLRTGCADSLLCIVTRLLISLLLHHKWEGRGWYIRVFSTRILVIFCDININKHWSVFFFCFFFFKS